MIESKANPGKKADALQAEEFKAIRGFIATL